MLPCQQNPELRGYSTLYSRLEVEWKVFLLLGAVVAGARKSSALKGMGSSRELAFAVFVETIYGICSSLL